MSISIGDIDVAQEIVELNFQLRRTQKLLEFVINKAINDPNILTSNDIEAADKDALEFVQKKFPNMGIGKKV